MDDPRTTLDELIRKNHDDYSGISRLLGRNAAYIQQYIKRGSPRSLDERDRAVLARYFGVDEVVLGGPTRRSGGASESFSPHTATTTGTMPTIRAEAPTPAKWTLTTRKTK